MTVMFVKVSILDLYIKIFRNATFIKVAYAYLGLQIVWSVVAFLQVMLLCVPIQLNWDKTIQGGRCGDSKKAYFASHIINFVLDFGTAMLPIAVLWNLKMPTQKKIGIMFLFCIGVMYVYSTLRPGFSFRLSD
jgi:hypothetical protein